MPYDSREGFYPPKDDAKLWRYMDFTKLLSLLRSRQLFFTRLNWLQDKCEGQPTPRDRGDIQRVIQTRIDSGEWAADAREWADKHVKGTIEAGRRHILVNCWHRGRYESAAMWKAFCHKEGVAVTTTFKNLRESFAPARPFIYIGRVLYIDRARDRSEPPTNIEQLYHALRKGRSFRHEREVRAATFDFSEVSTELFPSTEAGMPVEVCVERLIGEVYVSPHAESWLHPLVEDVVQKLFGLEHVPVHHSPLYRLD